MPAKSKKQQRFMGMVHAAQKGELKNPSPEVEKAADSMKKKDAEDFASTKHKGLPEKVKKKKVQEAFGQKLDMYIMIIDRWLEGQGFNDYDRDAIFNDPDNMDTIESGEAHGINPIKVAKELDIERVVTGLHASQMAHESFVPTSVDSYLNEGLDEDLFTEALMTVLMAKGLTDEEADFAIGNLDNFSIEDWAREYKMNKGAIEPIADQILKYMFGK